MDHVARIGGEEFALVVPESSEHEAYVLGERLRRAVREEFQGSDRQVTMSLGVASFPAHGGSTEALFQASDGALYAAKELGRDRCVIHNSEIAAALASAAARKEAQREGYLATILALAEALDVRDSGTAQHSQTVARYSELLARELELEEELVERVRLGGMLHDVGKIGVPDSVLNKPGPLDESEWREMRAHPLIAARILDSATVEDIRSWVLSHHERHDGTGYPQGLEGDDIPLEARILAVADAYEAMTSDRVYRPALAPDEARAELVGGAGSQFDPLVVQAMLRVLDRVGIAQLAA
jgi:putative nucleotidyltransferase with HDIG domain